MLSISTDEVIGGPIDEDPLEDTSDWCASWEP